MHAARKGPIFSKKILFMCWLRCRHLNIVLTHDFEENFFSLSHLTSVLGNFNRQKSLFYIISLFMQSSEFTKSTLSLNKEFSNKRTKLKITVPVMRETAQVR